MVAKLDTCRGLIRALDWQDVGRSRLRVRPVSCPVDPMRRYVETERSFTTPDVCVTARLRELQRLLEWAYGYRASKDARQRPSRRAPSAGGLYPTENFVVIETEAGWQVFYYDYAGHRFYLIEVADAGAVARALGLNHGGEAILFASILWRTVQRYGVRGYRYCLLDAAHVASNLARVARAVGRQLELDPCAPSAALETLLGFEHGEAVLLAARTRPGPRPVPAPPEMVDGLKSNVQLVEQPPLFCPALRRASDFHRSTLVGPGHGAGVPWVGPGETPDELYTWASTRSSVREFTGEAVTAEQYAQMAEAALRARQVLSQFAPAIHVYVIAARVPGMDVGVGQLGAECSAGGETSSQTAAGLTDALAEVCQNQSIMKGSAFAFVLAARKNELAVHSFAGYRPMVLNAGFLCADLYREAVRCGLGTTSIGGFSDDAVCRLLGDDSLTPIVIQAFGVPARSAEKIDAARIVGITRAAAG